MTNETTHDDIINKKIEEEHEFMRARIKELENKPTYPFNEAFNKQLQEENQKLKELNNALSGQLDFVKSELELRLSAEIKRSKFILGEFKKTDKQRNYWRETTEKYKQALDDIEQIAQTGLKPICYKSNCSRCKCYNNDDCKAGTKALLLNYFDKNGNFVDGNDDFSDELDFLVEKERKSCNRAKPISQKILDIIHKTRTVNNE